MIKLSARIFGCGVIAICGFGRTALADPPTTLPNPLVYTLINPVPDDALRDLDTDRPNKTNTPHTVDPGHVQIEAGIFDYVYDRDKYHGANSRSDAFDFGQFNFRVGVLSDLEINVVVNSIDFLRNTDDVSHQSSRQSGFGDTVVGGKLNLWGNAGSDAVWAAALGIQPQLKLASARENIGNGHPELSVLLPLLVNLPAQFRLSLQTTVSWERNSLNNGETTGWENAASIDRVIFNKLDVYLEYWSHVSTEHHQEAQQTLDVGVAYTVSANVQLDTGVNLGLNKATENIEWTAGVTVRF